MKFLLIKYHGTFMHESIDGCIIMKQEEWNNYKEKAKMAFDNEYCLSYSIGKSKTIIEYDNYDTFINSFSTIEINTAEKEFLEKIGLNDFGIFPISVFDSIPLDLI